MRKNAWIPYCQDDGKEYWEALQMVREWTKINHQLIHRATYAQFDKEPIHQFWNEHSRKKKKKILLHRRHVFVLVVYYYNYYYCCCVYSL